jgi:outer membrane protein assembly factor BamB
MTKSKSIGVALMIAAALTASGCATFKKGRKTHTPVIGQRIAVLTGENDATVDPATTALPMTLPGAVANTDWTQSGGNASKSMGQLALGTRLAVAFTVQAGRGSSLTARLAASPVVAGGHVFVTDTLGTVRAFDARTGAVSWASQTPTEKGGEKSMYGGGIAYDQGRIYATNGLGFVVAIDERNGGIVWKVRPGGPLRGAPTVANGAVYVMSQDNQIFSLKEEDGTTNWSAAARREISAPPRPPSGRAPWSPASPRASSTPIATKTGARCGRTRSSGPASAPACRPSMTSTPIRWSTAGR